MEHKKKGDVLRAWAPHHGRMNAFLCAVSFVLLPLFAPRLLDSLASFLADETLVTLITTLLALVIFLSIMYYVFKHSERYSGIRVGLLLFVMLANFVASVAGLVNFLDTNMVLLLFLPLINFHIVLLLLMTLFAGDPEELKSRGAHGSAVCNVLVGLGVIIVLYLVLIRILSLHWALALSLATIFSTYVRLPCGTPDWC